MKGNWSPAFAAAIGLLVQGLALSDNTKLTFENKVDPIVKTIFRPQ
jgi:hypothetical protein